jgi:hypothetical protein
VTSGFLQSRRPTFLFVSSLSRMLSALEALQPISPTRSRGLPRIATLCYLARHPFNESYSEGAL